MGEGISYFRVCVGVSVGFHGNKHFGKQSAMFYIGLITVSSGMNFITIHAQDMMGEAKIEPKSNLGYSLKTV